MLATGAVAVGGEVTRPGIYELPFGCTIDELLRECGAERTQAVQVGGPLGAYFPPSMFDLAFDYETFARAGGLIVVSWPSGMIDNFCKRRSSTWALASNSTKAFSMNSSAFF